MTAFSDLPIRRIDEHALSSLRRDAWPATIPAVQSILATGIELGPVTVLVGENGSGKSTLVEAIAQAYGLAAEGGSTGSMHRTRASESELHVALQLTRGAGASKRGYFLRAEAMHGFFTYLEQNPGGPEPGFQEMSHGESFVSLVESRFRGKGFWVLDEPESALSLTNCLALLDTLTQLKDAGGSQILLATHSPVLAALPGAAIYELGEWGMRLTRWDDLEMVRLWKLFLDSPDRFLRHLG